MQYIKSYSQLKELKELKHKQLSNAKVRLYADYYQLAYTSEKIKNGMDWWKKIMLGIQIYKQVRNVFHYFRR